MRDEAIVTEGLRRHFGPIKAVDGVDLAAPAGTVLGLLGPNGAGKTTIVRILTTLLDPDGGDLQIAVGIFRAQHGGKTENRSGDSGLTQKRAT